MIETTATISTLRVHLSSLYILLFIFTIYATFQRAFFFYNILFNYEGKLVAQDPDDEPAEILLERIKQEKLKHKKEGNSKRTANMDDTKQMKLI